MPKLVVHKRAAKYLDRMDRRMKEQLLQKFAELAIDPDNMSGIKPMSGEWAGFHRLRQGDFRVIFLYDRSEDTVIISHVGPRGDIY